MRNLIEALQKQKRELSENETYKLFSRLGYSKKDIQKELSLYEPNGRGLAHNPVAFELRGVDDAEVSVLKAMALSFKKKEPIYFVYQEPSHGFQGAIFVADPKTRSVQFVKEASNPQPDRYLGQFYGVQESFAKQIEALGLTYNPTPAPKTQAK